MYVGRCSSGGGGIECLRHLGGRAGEVSFLSPLLAAPTYVGDLLRTVEKTSSGKLCLPQNISALFSHEFKFFYKVSLGQHRESSLRVSALYPGPPPPPPPVQIRYGHCVTHHAFLQKRQTLLSTNLFAACGRGKRGGGGGGRGHFREEGGKEVFWAEARKNFRVWLRLCNMDIFPIFCHFFKKGIKCAGIVKI